jgi:threonine/homoserine/homoserine lactone efflux protein
MVERVDWIAPLVVFSVVSSGSPGPNNLMLWASGATFGLRRTVPHVVGTAIGIGAMTLAAAAGLAALITAVPAIAVAMKLGGSAYLLYLAWQIARAGDFQQATLARPLSLVQAATFQLINPKAWTFALGAITTFRPAALPIVTGSIAVSLTMMAVIVPTALAWAVAVGAISRLLVGERSRRLVSLALAAVVAATVALVWL